MDIIRLFLVNRIEDAKLIDVMKQFERTVMSAGDPVVFQLVKNPFPLFRFTNILPTSSRHIGGRAYLMDGLFVNKYDEHFKANSLSFIANLFAKPCKVRCPEMILSEIKYIVQREDYGGDEQLVQIIEYIPNWNDYSHQHPRSVNFPKQLAGLLAFDLVIGNVDRFMFIFRFVDNTMFEQDPGFFTSFFEDDEFEPHEIWMEDIINEGNFGFVGLDVWSIDHTVFPEGIAYINKLHQMLSEAFLRECSLLMSQYFKLTDAEQVLFNHKLRKYVSRNLKLWPEFRPMYDWVMEQ